MHIVHYSLGFPPYRRGGMTEYCIDLALQQVKENKVYLLWPGQINSYKKDVIIRRHSSFKKINSFELINPLPVPLVNGIGLNGIEYYSSPKSETVFINFFKKYDIQVFHVHTLMGLPIEALQAAKKSKIKIIYTTHDYYGVGPTNFIVPKQLSWNYNYWVQSGLTSYSLKKIKFLQSPLYRLIKSMYIVKYLKKFKKSVDTSEDFKIEDNYPVEVLKKYKNLHQYYLKSFQYIDFFHFNSTVSEKIFKFYLGNKINGKVISITNKWISNNKKLRSYNTSSLNIGYFGPIDKVKGFYFLNDILKDLKNKYKFKLIIHVNENINEDYIVNEGRYNIENLNKVLENIDIMIVPSQWFETFGFTTLEAMSYGIPVIVSNLVGSKDLVHNGKDGYIFKNARELRKQLISVLNNKEFLLKRLNRYIVKNDEIKTIEQHDIEMEALYKKLILES